MFFVGVSLAFFLLHTFLYAFHRREPGNLHLALSALGFALFMGQEAADPGELSTEAIAGLESMGVAGISIMILGFIRFGHYFTRQHAPRIFGFFVMAAIAAVVAHAISGSLLVPQVVALLSLAELLRGLARGFAQPPGPRAWVVGLGFLAVFLTALSDSLAGLGVLPGSFGGVYPYGMLLLFVSMSVYLSWRFADTRSELERKLVEVEELTERAIEQERRAQQKELERQLLERDHERQRSELEAARALQLSMLPSRPPSAGELVVDFEMRTASEVGGDFYDYREHSDGTLTIAVGDATGHGLDAGLLVGATKGLFHAAAEAPDLALVLNRIADGLVGLSLRRRNMALLLCRWRPGGPLELIAAGMPPLYVYRRRDRRVEEHLLGAPPVASLSGHDYRGQTIPLEPGDTLLAISDGLVERQDPNGEALGYRRLQSAFAEAGAESIERIRQVLFARAEAWAAGRPRSDDETVVIVRRREPRARGEGKRLGESGRSRERRVE